MAQRNPAIERFRRYPLEVQRDVFDSLMKCGSKTKYGSQFSISETTTPEQFARIVPLNDYDSFKPQIERMLAGEADVATVGRIKMFARSSGTTSERSKYIPISERSFWNNHLRGMRDVSTIYNAMQPASKILDGKTLTLGGSCCRERNYLVGDLSGLLIKRFVYVSGWLRAPSMKSALIGNFDQKCEAICRECTTQNITAFAGVPSWNLSLMSRVLEYTGKSSIREVWPNMELFVHGGVEMTPYRQAFHNIDGGGVRYMETYNASEGFFAIADSLSRDDMLLMLDYETYFEFRSGETVVPLEGVELGRPYAVIITSSNGLWRYEIGDTVEFTSLDPYRIRFAGRTRQYINAFGEEVIVENSDRAIVEVCRAHGAVLSDYMVAPRFMSVGERGCHQWLIEFIVPPTSISEFTSDLDAALRRINSDYDAKRASSLAQLEVDMLHAGSFVKWMRLNKRNKLPRLSNDRKLFDKVLEWLEREKAIIKR